MSCPSSRRPVVIVSSLIRFAGGLLEGESDVSEMSEGIAEALSDATRRVEEVAVPLNSGEAPWPVTPPRAFNA